MGFYLEKPIKIYKTFENFEKDYIRKYNDDSIVVINFWATWCGPCVKELVYFEKLTEKYKDTKLKVVLVSLDIEKDIETKLKSFLTKKILKSEVIALIDSRQSTWIDKVDVNWSGAIPATIIFKGDQKSFYERDFETFEDLEKLVLK